MYNSFKHLTKKPTFHYSVLGFPSELAIFGRLEKRLKGNCAQGSWGAFLWWSQQALNMEHPVAMENSHKLYTFMSYRYQKLGVKETICKADRMHI